MKIRQILCFSMIVALISCKSLKDRYFLSSFSKTDILESIEVGDSIKVHFGDSIKFRYFKNNPSMDKGNVLVVKNEYEIYEFYEYGEWSTYHYDGKLRSRMVFDPELGIISEKAWNYYTDSAMMLCDNYRILKDDSLLEYQKWYYPNGTLEQEKKYLIQRPANKKRRHHEKRTLIKKKKYHNEEGEILKKKYFKGK